MRKSRSKTRVRLCVGLATTSSRSVTRITTDCYANSRPWDVLQPPRYLTTDTDGAAKLLVTELPILTAGIYYFWPHCGTGCVISGGRKVSEAEQRVDPTNSLNAEAAYAVHLDFDYWNFPHGNVPAPFDSLPKLEQLPPQFSVKGSAKRIKAVKQPEAGQLGVDSMEAAHIIPDSKAEWFIKNNMS